MTAMSLTACGSDDDDEDNGGSKYAKELTGKWLVTHSRSKTTDKWMESHSWKNTYTFNADGKVVGYMDEEKNLRYVEQALSGVPENFSGKMLEVPVGTGVLTMPVYRELPDAEITCLDYSSDMMAAARKRAEAVGLANITFRQGDVGALPFEEGSFDVVLCMNGLHVFPNKDKAYSEILRTLKPGGELLACFYIAGEQKVADWLAKTVMTRMGWFTPPFNTANDVRQRLETYYDILDFHVEGAMLYFKAKKR